MTSSGGAAGIKRIYLRCERIPIVGSGFTAFRLVVAHGDIRGAARSLRSGAKTAYLALKASYRTLEKIPFLGRLATAFSLALKGNVRGAGRYLFTYGREAYSCLEKVPLIGWPLRKARPFVAAAAVGVPSFLAFARSPRQLYWRMLRRRREAVRLSRIASSTAVERRQQGRSGYLYPYEFDAAATKYGDIKSIIEHHEHSKPLVSAFYRALYDLRSGIVLRMVWVMEEVLEHHVKSFGLELDGFAPYQLLHASCGGIDPRKQSIQYLQSATHQDPRLGEAYYQLGVIYRAEQRLDEALECLQAASKLPPTMLPGTHDIPLMVRSYYEAGLVLRDLRRFNEALASFEKAVELAPEFPDAHRMLAEELRRAGRYAQAGEHFHRAMFYRPILPLLPSLPMRLAPAPASGTARLFDPEIGGILLDRPVPLPSTSIAPHRGFRVFKLFDQTYGVPEGDGPINCPSLIAGDHALMFVDPEWDKVVHSINEYLDR